MNSNTPAESTTPPASTSAPEGVPAVGPATNPEQPQPVRLVAWKRGAGKSRRWGIVAGVAVPAVLLAGTGVASGAYSTWAVSHFIAPGVTIAGVPVGGMTKEQAVDELEQRYGQLYVSLNTEKKPYVIPLRDLGGEPAIQGTVSKAYQIGRDGSLVGNFMRVYGSKAAGERMSLPVVWDKEDLVKRLRRLQAQCTEAPRNARLSITSSGVQIEADTPGRTLDVGETALRLQKSYFVGLASLDAASKELPAELTASSLSGKDIELGRYTTRFNIGLRGRTANVHIAASAIDGSVVMPGERFSFNSKTGERTYEKGYRMAHIFEKQPGDDEAQVVDGLAGGTCQVSSTLFNALMRVNKKTDGGLRIMERHHHSLPVTYVPDGQDATVAWPSLDLKFRNNLNHPIYLRTNISGSHLTVSIWGRVLTTGTTSPATASSASPSDEATPTASATPETSPSAAP